MPDDKSNNENEFDNLFDNDNGVIFFETHGISDNDINNDVFNESDNDFFFTFDIKSSIQ